MAVLEKARGVGGRMATRRFGEAVCDHGTQYFSVKGRAFGSVVSEAQDSNAVMPWCDLFPHSKTEDGPLVEPLDEVGHARWRGARGMTSLPKYLAAQLAEPVRTGVRVGSIGVQDNTVRLVCENNDVVVARAAVLTVPVPQALEIFDSGGLRPPVVDSAVWDVLASVEYVPCFSLMLWLSKPSLLLTQVVWKFVLARLPGLGITIKKEYPQCRASRFRQPLNLAGITSMLTRGKWKINS